jgi:hypothetical protein
LYWKHKKVSKNVIEKKLQKIMWILGIKVINVKIRSILEKLKRKQSMRILIDVSWKTMVIKWENQKLLWVKITHVIMKKITNYHSKNNM